MGLLDQTSQTTEQTKSQTKNQNDEKIGKNIFDADRNTTLIFGQPKVGKTWVTMRYIKDTLDNGGNVYLFNTDRGVSKTFKQYFGERAKEVAEKITLFEIRNMKDAEIAINSVKGKITPKDLIIVDLMSDIWTFAQNKFIEDSVGASSPIDYLVQMSKDKTTFGNFKGVQWQYITKVDSWFTQEVVLDPPCDVIGICGEKDLESENAMSKGKANETFKDFVDLGVRPDGNKRLQYKFDTIVYLGMMNKNRYIQVVGDRGTPGDKKMHSLDKEFKDKLEEIRK